MNSNMIFITAPNDYQVNANNSISIFLAGGISKCSPWQGEVISYLKDHPLDTNNKTVVIFSPRREGSMIDFTNQNEIQKQIEWEFKYLENMSIFTMFFDGPTESPQPICFYELGRHLSQMMQRFPNDYDKRIIVSYKKEFFRSFDVNIQTELATQNKVKAYEVSSSQEHAERILEAIKELYKNKIIN